MKRELWGKNARKTEFQSIWWNHCQYLFFALSLVDNKIQAISLAGKLTVWCHIGARNFYLSVLLLMIKVSQSQSKKLICYCKNKFFSNPQPNLCLQFYNNVNGVRYFKTREHFLNSRAEFAGLQPSHVLSSTCVPVEPCTSYFHDTFSFLFTYLFC